MVCVPVALELILINVCGMDCLEPAPIWISRYNRMSPGENWIAVACVDWFVVSQLWMLTNNEIISISAFQILRLFKCLSIWHLLCWNTLLLGAKEIKQYICVDFLFFKIIQFCFVCMFAFVFSFTKKILRVKSNRRPINYFSKAEIYFTT